MFQCQYCVGSYLQVSELELYLPPAGAKQCELWARTPRVRVSVGGVKADELPCQVGSVLDGRKKQAVFFPPDVFHSSAVLNHLI